MQFSYVAKSTAGETVAGVLNADGELFARRQLREQGLFVVGIEPGSGSAARVAGGSSKRVRAKRRDLLSLTTQLAIMTRAGIDPASALKCLVEHCRNPKLKPVLTDVLSAVEGGRSLSDGLRSHPAVFDEAFTASVAAGEAAGELPKVLGHLVQLLRSDISRRATIRGLMAYPVLLLSISGLVIAGLVVFVLPEFARVFQEMAMPLPAITKLLLATSGALSNHVVIWVPALIVVALGAVTSYYSGAGRALLDRLVLRAAVVRDITRSLLVGRTFRLLGMLLESGVPALEAVRLVHKSIRNHVFALVFERMQDDLLNGRALSYSLFETDVLPPETAEMIITAERTGTLGVVTMMMGEHYEEQAEGKLRDLATILEPSIVVLMGLVVGVVILAVMLPMFDMATVAGG